MKINLLAWLLALLLSGAAFAQNGIDKPQYQIITHRAGAYLGTFNIELFPLIAPLHVQNFDSLVTDQFYDSTAFHRVVPGFVIQGGDPNSVSGPVSTWGYGQPWQVTVPAEFSVVRHLRGILGAARDVDPNSATSQFYICVANATFLDGNYTVYGKVTSGMNIVDTIVSSPRDGNDVPLQKIEMFVSYTGVNDSIPDSPSLIAPADASNGILNTQLFTWTAVNSALMYTVEFSTDPSFSTINISMNSAINSVSVPSLQGSTTYYWRVKSNNGGHESAPSNIYSFNSATAAPQLTFPPDLSTGIVLNPVFAWDPVPNADSYTLQVSVSPTFTVQNMIYNTAGLTGTSQQVSGLNPNALYYWRVRSASGTTQGFYSSKFSFTTGTTIGYPELQVALNSIAIIPNPSTNHSMVYLSLPSREIIKISLKDITGRQVHYFEQTHEMGDFVYKLDLYHYQRGIYFMQCDVGGVSVSRLVVVN